MAVIGRDLEFQHVVVFFILNIDFVCLYTYEFLLSLCKIARSSVILLLALFNSIPEVVMPSSYKTPDECLDFLYVQKRKIS